MEKKICNCCGEEFNEYEVVKIDHAFSYGSKFDMSRLQGNICNGCYDKFVDKFISECKINPLLEWDGEYYKVS